MLDAEGNVIDAEGNVQADLPATDAPIEGAAPIGEVAPVVEPPRKDGLQERIDELTGKRRDAERDAAYWRGVAEAKTPVKEVPEEKDLDPNDFNSDAEYLKAVAKKVKDEIREEISQETQRREIETKGTTLNTLYQKAREKYSDFDSVALNPSIQITQGMFDAAMGDSLGDVLHHLGSNPAEASRIAALSPTQQIKEIGKIEDRLVSSPSGRTQTNAPNPPATVGGGGSSPPKKDIDKTRTELHAEWEAARRKEAGL